MIYHIKLVRILRYNVLLNYYRVLLQGFSSELIYSVVTVFALQSVVDESRSKINKGHI